MLTQDKQLNKTSMNMMLMNTSPWQYFQNAACIPMPRLVSLGINAISWLEDIVTKQSIG